MGVDFSLRGEARGQEGEREDTTSQRKRNEGTKEGSREKETAGKKCKRVKIMSSSSDDSKQPHLLIFTFLQGICFLS